jgi:hypothetical protein
MITVTTSMILTYLIVSIIPGYWWASVGVIIYLTLNTNFNYTMWTMCAIGICCEVLVAILSDKQKD